MRLLLIAVLLATFGWCGYWFLGSSQVESGWRNWLDGRAEAGWVANYAEVATRGFPNRFDTTLGDLELADPATGLAWTAPFLQVLRLSYKPNHLIVAFPPTQSLATPRQRIAIAGQGRASLVLVPGADMEADRASVVFDELALVSNAGWSVKIGHGELHTRRAPALTLSQDISLDLTGLRPEGGNLAALAASGLVPAEFRRLTLRATLGFDAPWDRAAVETRRPAITAVDLDLMQANWGELELWAAGKLTVDPEGRATGSITVKAKNWREMLALGVAAGWVPEAMHGALESALEFLAGLSGSPATLDAPLTFKNGAVSFGPIPLGTAPLLRLR